MVTTARLNWRLSQSTRVRSELWFPSDHLGPDAIGPGARGSKFYDSSGFTFSGNMYLATVSIQTEAGIVQTNSIEVVAIDSSSCNKPGCKPPSTQLFYLGVGYDRNTTAAGDLLDSPSQNAFLNVTDTSNGTDIAQGYILTKNTTGGATLGVSPADLETFTPITLTPSSVSPGDWTAMAGASVSRVSAERRNFAVRCCSTSVLRICSLIYRRRNGPRVL